LITAAAIYFVTCALSGYMFKPASWIERVLLGAGGVLLIFPPTQYKIIGAVVLALPVIYQLIKVMTKKVTSGLGTG
jgi:TRAP-type uncharacterized transport system fused permease subunit